MLRALTFVLLATGFLLTVLVALWLYTRPPAFPELPGPASNRARAVCTDRLRAKLTECLPGKDTNRASLRKLADAIRAEAGKSRLLAAGPNMVTFSLPPYDLLDQARGPDESLLLFCDLACIARFLDTIEDVGYGGRYGCQAALWAKWVPSWLTQASPGCAKQALRDLNAVDSLEMEPWEIWEGARENLLRQARQQTSLPVGSLIDRIRLRDLAAAESPLAVRITYFSARLQEQDWRSLTEANQGIKLWAARMGYGPGIPMLASQVLHAGNPWASIALVNAYEELRPEDWAEHEGRFDALRMRLAQKLGQPLDPWPGDPFRRGAKLRMDGTRVTSLGPERPLEL